MAPQADFPAVQVRLYFLALSGIAWLEMATHGATQSFAVQEIALPGGTLIAQRPPAAGRHS